MRLNFSCLENDLRRKYLICRLIFWLSWMWSPMLSRPKEVIFDQLAVWRWIIAQLRFARAALSLALRASRCARLLALGPFRGIAGPEGPSMRPIGRTSSMSHADTWSRIRPRRGPRIADWCQWVVFRPLRRWFWMGSPYVWGFRPLANKVVFAMTKSK